VLLAASGLDTHPQVGRNLRLHPTVAVIGIMEEPVDMWLGPLQAASCTQFRAAGPASDDGIGPAHGGFLVESAPPHPGLAAAALSWEGRDDAAALMDLARRWAPLIGIIHERGSGRVRAAAGGRAVIDYRLDAADAGTALRALVEMSRPGAVELRTGSTPAVRWRRGDSLAAYLRSAAHIDPAPNRLSLFSAHQMGTVRAGADPLSHPADPGGRLRRDAGGTLAAGVFIGDGSLLPSAPGVNPMLTIMAMAERTARTVIEDSTIGSRKIRP
jgi:choline dehydrogenase-like flavoprotein